MAESILKDESLKIDFSKTIYLNDFISSEWMDELTETPVQVNGAYVCHNEHTYCIYTQETYQKCSKLVEPFPTIKRKYFREFYQLKNNGVIEIQSPEEVFKYIYLDAFLYLEIIYQKKQLKEPYSYYENKLLSILDNNVAILKEKETQSTKSKWKRSNLLKTNANAIEWRQDRKKFISHETNKLIESINPQLIELPADYDLDRLKFCLKTIVEQLDTYNIKKRSFSLRFKKLGLYKKQGMFIKRANTIIIDPRNIMSFKHELGHYLYENGIAFDLNGKRIYKSRFKALSKDTVIDHSYNHHLEECDESSERFAHWFENL